MEKLHWTFKKIISLILGLLGIGTLTSCYGVVPYGTPSFNGNSFYTLSGKVKGNVNKESKNIEPVKNIEISIKAKKTSINGEPNQSDEYFDLDETTKTDDNGDFTIDWELKDFINDYTITFKDIDGQENGSFNNKTVEVKFTNEDIIYYNEFYKNIDDIELETKSDNDNYKFHI